MTAELVAIWMNFGMDSLAIVISSLWGAKLYTRRVRKVKPVTVTCSG